MVVKSQIITMAEKRLKEPFMSGRLFIFVQPTTNDNQSAYVKKTITEEQQRKSALAAVKKLDIKDTLITLKLIRTTTFWTVSNIVNSSHGIGGSEVEAQVQLCSSLSLA